MTSERDGSIDPATLHVCKQYSQFYFITIICVDFHSTYTYHICISSQLVRERLSVEARMRAIQEEIAGFLMKEVLHDKGEHYGSDAELYMGRRSGNTSSTYQTV